jgi:hypothetical protein
MITFETVIYCPRDPTDKDIQFENILWISLEYVPYRVFKGGNGKWVFFGKLMPEPAFRSDS